MDKIYQKFDLNTDFKAWAMAKSDGETRRKLKEKLEKRLGGELVNLPQAAQILRQELLNRGYVVLESDDVYHGLHGSIIIGGEIGKVDHKTDFYKLAAKFKLPYISGHSYFEPKLEQLAQSEKLNLKKPLNTT